MPTILIFDDDSRKIALCDLVLKALNKRGSSAMKGLGEAPWTLGFDQEMNCFAAASTFVEQLCKTESPLLLIDIEIKPGTKQGASIKWRTEATKRIEALVRKDEKMLFEETRRQLAAVYHNHANYQLSLALLSFARIRGIFAMTISTKPNSRDQLPNYVKAGDVDLPSISNWSENWQTDWIKNRIATVKGIADNIGTEWQKWSGTMEQRLWPGEAICHPGWFSGGKAVHKIIPHSSDSAKYTASAYKQRIRQYVEAVTGCRLPVGWTPPPGCHDTLKQLVGAAAKAHAKSGSGYVPLLNTVAFLAAVWDPNASKWFPSYNWRADCPLTPEAATQIELREAILAIGGEDGLFAKIIPKEGAPKVSNLKTVRGTESSLLLEFTFDLTKDKRGGSAGIKQQFDTAHKGESLPHGGEAIKETSQRLIDAWRKLAIRGKRMIEVEVTKHAIIFKKWGQS